mmetsp:Transcript_8009/g.14430  ORF Transcript_8009/g.14430 Transcript_8009/m.14430 type:complete len:222 (+) Transcript_8009:1044-1709(+)
MSTHSARRRRGPILSRGIRTASLLRKATNRNKEAGERERITGRAFLSRASDDVDTPRLDMSFTTCSAAFEPLIDNRPGQARNTFLASYFRNFRVLHKSPANDCFKISSTVSVPTLSLGFSFCSVSICEFPLSLVSSFSRSVNILDRRSVKPSSPGTRASSAIIFGVRAVIMAILGVCSKMVAISFPVKPYSHMTSITFPARTSSIFEVSISFSSDFKVSTS